MCYLDFFAMPVDRYYVVHCSYVFDVWNFCFKEWRMVSNNEISDPLDSLFYVFSRLI